MAGEGAASGGAAGASTAGGAGAASAGASGAAAGGGQAGASQGAGVGREGAGLSTGTSAAPASGTQAGASDWTSTLSDDFKGFVQNKGWKAPAEVLDSYRNLEKLVRAPQDQVVQIPKFDDVEGWNGVYSKLGRPSTPDGYKLETPKEGGDPEFTKWAQDKFHKAGLSETQAKQLASEWNADRAGKAAAKVESVKAQAATDMATLKKEWGAAYDQNTSVAQRAAKTFGASSEVIDAMEAKIGTLATLKFFQNIGEKMGESKFVQGNGNYSGDMSGPMTPSQARDAIKTLQGDYEFGKKYMAGDAKARQQMETLHKYAYQDA